MNHNLMYFLVILIRIYNCHNHENLHFTDIISSLEQKINELDKISIENSITDSSYITISKECKDLINLGIQRYKNFNRRSGFAKRSNKPIILPNVLSRTLITSISKSFMVVLRNKNHFRYPLIDILNTARDLNQACIFAHTSFDRVSVYETISSMQSGNGTNLFQMLQNLPSNVVIKYTDDLENCEINVPKYFSFLFEGINKINLKTVNCLLIYAIFNFPEKSFYDFISTNNLPILSSFFEEFDILSGFVNFKLLKNAKEVKEKKVNCYLYDEVIKSSAILEGDSHLLVLENLVHSFCEALSVIKYHPYNHFFFEIISIKIGKNNLKVMKIEIIHSLLKLYHERFSNYSHEFEQRILDSELNLSSDFIVELINININIHNFKYNSFAYKLFKLNESFDFADLLKIVNCFCKFEKSEYLIAYKFNFFNFTNLMKHSFEELRELCKLLCDKTTKGILYPLRDLSPMFDQIAAKNLPEREILELYEIFKDYGDAIFIAKFIIVFNVKKENI